MHPFRDYYQILGISQSANVEEIKQAFRRLARQCHPDVAGAEGIEQFQQISEAYQILKDPVRRQQFDLQCRQEKPSHPKEARVFVKTEGTQEPRRRSFQDRIRHIKDLLKKRHPVQAVSQAEALYQDFPQEPEVLHCLAFVTYRLGSELRIRGEKSRAESYLRKALALEPNNRELAFEIKRELKQIGVSL
jgi:curved DNA-binding protein CbpA